MSGAHRLIPVVKGHPDAVAADVLDRIDRLRLSSPDRSSKTGAALVAPEISRIQPQRPGAQRPLGVTHSPRRG